MSAKLNDMDVTSKEITELANNLQRLTKSSKRELQRHMQFIAQEQRNRIVDRNLAGTMLNGAKFPEYSTLSMYINVSAPGMSKFAPMGKNGSNVFKNGNPKKSRYFEGGYKQAREESGRSTTNDRLTWTGRLMDSMQAVRTKEGAMVTFQGSDFQELAGYNNQRTPFFGMNAEDLLLAGKTAQSMQEALLRRFNNG